MLTPEEREAFMERAIAEAEAARVKTEDLTAHLSRIIADMRSASQGTPDRQAQALGASEPVR